MHEDSHNNDYFVTTEHEGIGSRVKNSLGGLCFGPLLVAISIALLIWNEGRNAHRLRDLQETRRLLATQSPDITTTTTTTIDESNNSKLLYLFGACSTSPNYLNDPDFGLSIENAVKLRRRVETYQWVEEERTERQKTTGGGQTTTRTYTYSKEWKRGIENSKSFHSSTYHENPEYAQYNDVDYTADAVSLGAYTLGSTVVSNHMNWYVTVTTISADTVVVDQSNNKNNNNNNNNNHCNAVQIYKDKYYYCGDNPRAPQVGDTRVWFQVVQCGEMSIIAAQQQQPSGDANYNLVPYQTSRGGTVILLEPGIVSANVMIGHAESENTLFTWGLRALGVAVSFCGLILASQPLILVFDIVLPCVGDLMDIAMSGLAFVVATTISATVIAIAWLFYRPLMGGTMLLVIGGALYCLLVSRRRTKAQIIVDEGYPGHANIHYGPYAGTSPHYPSSYQQQYVVGSSASNTTPFAQVLDTQFFHQTLSSPALNAPVLAPPAVLPPSVGHQDYPAVYKPFS